MTLDEQVAIIDALPELERDALGLVCINRDQDVPKELLAKLQKRGMIVRGIGNHYVAVSYWLHRAWCEWSSRQEGSRG